MDFEFLYEKVKETLSEKRFYHSKCVMEKCIELARIYGEDEEKAKIAGILHDIAKEIPKEKRIETAKKYKVELDEIEKNSLGLIHAKLGAKICEIDYGVSKEICDAIKVHTTGKENMSLLQKILFISDAIGIDRKYSNTEQIRNLAKENLDEAIVEILRFSIEDRIKEKKLVHIDSINALNYLILEKEKLNSKNSIN